MTLRALLFVLLACSPALADADAPTLHTRAAASSGYDIGFRIGGYGFRREGDTSVASWNECRMDGLGLFATRGLTGPLFLEAGLDAYFSADFPIANGAMDLPIDRTSGLASLAIGARTNLAPWLRAYVQLGTGVELTKVSVPYQNGARIRDDKVMPEGFFGIGMDLRIAPGTYVGASLRTLVMGNFNYDPSRLAVTDAWVAAPKAEDVFAASPSLAAQGQFYVRRDL